MRHLGEAVNVSQSMIHRSHRDDVFVPLETVHRLVATTAERRPDGVAAIDAEAGRCITYRELDAAVEASWCISSAQR